MFRFLSRAFHLQPSWIQRSRSRTAGSPPALLTSSQQGPRTILVAIGFGPPSRRALRRADELARALGYTLRIVHVIPESGPEPRMPEFMTQQLAEVPDSVERMQATVQAWAAFLAGVMVPTSQILAVRGDAIGVLLQEASRPDVALVVLGRSEHRAVPNRTLAHKLLRTCPRPVLVVGERGLRRSIVAATDCSDSRLPVLWAAASLVPALGQKVTAVLNLDDEASRLSAAIGRPLTPQLAGLLCTGMQEWLDAERRTRSLLITNETDNARGVLSVVRSEQADLLVVGAKNDLLADRRTAESLLSACPTSVLFVPLGRVFERAARCDARPAVARAPLALAHRGAERPAQQPAAAL